MHDWWEFLEKDVLAIFAAFSSKDLQYPFALILWIILIAMPLHGVDRRDGITGLCYTLYCTATGITLFLALPKVVNSFHDIGLHLAFFSVFAGIAAYRWFHRNEQFILVSGDPIKKKSNQQDLDHEKT